MATYIFTYASVLESEESMLSDLAKVLSENSIVNSERNDFMLIISEAFTNALLHGNQMNPNKNIYLHIDIKSNQLSADIIDEGELGLREIQSKKPSELYGTNGRGVDLIRHYSSHVDFTEAENGGTKVSMVLDRKLEKVTS